MSKQININNKTHNKNCEDKKGKSFKNKKFNKKAKYLTLFSLLFIGVCGFFVFSAFAKKRDKTFVIIIPSYNNIRWYDKNLYMLAQQNKTYKNWRAIYIDDCSTDGTGEAVQKYISDNNLSAQVQFIRNPQNMGAMYNLYHAIHACKDDEIVITYDGDDWFANENVLTTLNTIYNDKNIWITYGQYVTYPMGWPGISKQIPDFVTDQNSFRQYAWLSSHLRTFYAGLFKKIKQEDLMENGKFYVMTWDQAIMYPMLEMAGHHAKFVDKVLYVYNGDNPISDWRKDEKLLHNTERAIRGKEKYNRIDTLFS